MAFRFKWVPFAATVLVVALGVSLGRWQDRRAADASAADARLQAGQTAAPLLLDAATAQATAQVSAASTAQATAAATSPATEAAKSAVIASATSAATLSATEAAALEYRRVRVNGQFVAGWPLYLDNRPSVKGVGFHLLMPFRIAGSDQHVLVARGWLPRNMAVREQLPPYGTPAGEVTLDGVLRLHPGRVMQLGTAPALTPGAIVQNATVAEVAAASGLPMQPFIIEQTAPANAQDSGLVHDWPAPASRVDKHRGYAFQWYALAAMAALFFVVTGSRRGKQN